MKFEIVSPKETITTFELKTNRELVDGIVEEFYTVSTAKTEVETKQTKPLTTDNPMFTQIVKEFEWLAEKPTAHRINTFRESFNKYIRDLSKVLTPYLKDSE